MKRLEILIKKHMTKKEKIKYLLSKKNTRIELCKRSFFFFCLYYFAESIKYPSAQFHKDYCKSLENWESILFNWFRECAKTVYAKYYIIRCICYSKKRYIVFFCDENKKASDKILDVASQLQINNRIIADFGHLYKGEEKDLKTSKKRMWDFETTNRIKVEAMGMGEVFRWKVYGVPWLWEARPDLIVLDDIDTQKSTNTTLLIDKNYSYIKNEINGWKSDDAQIVFLYNTIKEDGCGPRLREDYKDTYMCMKVPMIDDTLDPETITRPQRYTIDSIMKKKQESGDIAFAQNYLLIPYIWWQAIIKRDRIVIQECDVFDKIQIWVDPAISTKTSSDGFAICVAWYAHNKRHIIKTIALYGEAKTQGIDLVENLYREYKANVVNVETVAFQEMLFTQLKARWIAVEAINTHKDKTTRLMEREQDFKSARIVFLPWNDEAISQLVNFPNGRYDDLVDAILFATNESKIHFFLW